MNKEKAREILESCVKCGILPIYDCVVYREFDYENGIQREYTFRALLCLVYDLNEKK